MYKYESIYYIFYIHFDILDQLEDKYRNYIIHNYT